MIYPIVKYGNPVLETPAQTVSEFNHELRRLADDMFESMYHAHGVGLAAPQIGISKRMVVIDVTFKEDPSAKLVLVNPEIIGKQGKQVSGEGCLSLPGFEATVVRPTRVVVKALDREGNDYEREGTGLLARAFQHEMDHLDGTLFVDRLRGIKRDMIRRKIRKLSRAGKW